MRVQETNPSRLAMLLQQEFELCNVTEGETVAILSESLRGANT